MEGKLLIDALFDLQEYWRREHSYPTIPMRYISPKSYNLLLKAVEKGTANVLEVQEHDHLYRVHAENENKESIRFSIPKAFLEDSEKWSEMLRQRELHERLDALKASTDFFERKLKEDADKLEEMKKEIERYERNCEECDRKILERYGEEYR